MTDPREAAAASTPRIIDDEDDVAFGINCMADETVAVLRKAAAFHLAVAAEYRAGGEGLEAIHGREMAAAALNEVANELFATPLIRAVAGGYEIIPLEKQK